MSEPRLVAVSPAQTPRRTLLELKGERAALLSLAARFSVDGKDAQAMEARKRAGELEAEITGIRSGLRRKNGNGAFADKPTLLERHIASRERILGAANRKIETQMNKDTLGAIRTMDFARKLQENILMLKERLEQRKREPKPQEPLPGASQQGGKAGKPQIPIPAVSIQPPSQIEAHASPIQPMDQEIPRKFARFVSAGEDGPKQLMAISEALKVIPEKALTALLEAGIIPVLSPEFFVICQAKAHDPEGLAAPSELAEFAKLVIEQYGEKPSSSQIKEAFDALLGDRHAVYAAKKQETPEKEAVPVTATKPSRKSNEQKIKEAAEAILKCGFKHAGQVFAGDAKIRADFLWKNVSKSGACNKKIFQKALSQLKRDSIVIEDGQGLLSLNPSNETAQAAIAELKKK